MANLKRVSRQGRACSVLGAAFGALALTLITTHPAGAQASVFNVSLTAYKDGVRAGAFTGGDSRNDGKVTFVSATQAAVTGTVYDTAYDGWCALVSMTVNDGFADARTIRRETCGYQSSAPVGETFTKRIRLYNIKVAVGHRVRARHSGMGILREAPGSWPPAGPAPGWPPGAGEPLVSQAGVSGLFGDVSQGFVVRAEGRAGQPVGRKIHDLNLHTVLSV
ncbi:hypothetical protein ACFOY2_14320 [Nonomuraea purpurea]|uniref:Uncharacterized protein n=1 Tax=Nonomuraea purpurea TaxID=1849276 RepID=A0ABV8G347_9ACTN